jgi:magnesium transporter
MTKDVIQVSVDVDQEQIARLFQNQDLMALPVVDEQGHMQGIVTFDDVAAVLQEEATEDIQKMGAVETLDAPYLKTSSFEMIKKRGGWLMILFFGETFTATAMSYYQIDIQKAVVLTLFIPLIISSGGNSGSQASTLIIRAMALGEVRIRDWWRVLKREILAGLSLGALLGFLGFLKIVLWPTAETVYGPHYFQVALTVCFSLVGIVIWGTMAGSMLPLLLRKLKFDPASASAPAVATIVDVTGLIIYFTVASLFLSGTLL